jgi:ribosomal protein S18 acetylase RimI-like enzyme
MDNRTGRREKWMIADANPRMAGCSGRPPRIPYVEVSAMLRTRIARADDRRIYRMIHAYLMPYKRTFFPNASLSRRELHDRLKKGITYVTVPGPGRPIDGFCHALVVGKTLWIDLLAVDSRRRNRGRGSLLIRRAERYGRLHGCRTSQLYVDEHNAGAQAFYRKLGYEAKDYVQALRCYLFAKPLRGRRSAARGASGGRSFFSAAQREGVPPRAEWAVIRTTRRRGRRPWIGLVLSNGDRGFAFGPAGFFPV